MENKTNFYHSIMAIYPRIKKVLPVLSETIEKV